MTTRTRSRKRSSAAAITPDPDPVPSKPKRTRTVSAGSPLERYLNHDSPLTRSIAQWMVDSEQETIGQVANNAGLNFSTLRDSMERGFRSIQVNSLQKVLSGLMAIGYEPPCDVITELIVPSISSESQD